MNRQSRCILRKLSFWQGGYLLPEYHILEYSVDAQRCEAIASVALMVPSHGHVALHNSFSKKKPRLVQVRLIIPTILHGLVFLYHDWSTAGEHWQLKGMDGTSKQCHNPVWFANTSVATHTHTFLSHTIRCLLLLWRRQGKNSAWDTRIT